MGNLTQERVHQLSSIAKKIRIDILEMITKASSGHTGGSLSIADLITLLYFEEMNIDPENPQKSDRDRLVLSKGHAAPAIYAALAEKGYFAKEELFYLRQANKIPCTASIFRAGKISHSRFRSRRPLRFREYRRRTKKNATFRST